MEFIIIIIIERKGTSITVWMVGFFGMRENLPELGEREGGKNCRLKVGEIYERTQKDVQTYITCYKNNNNYYYYYYYYYYRITTIVRLWSAP